MDLRTLHLQEKYNKNINAIYRVLEKSISHWMVPQLTEIFNVKHGFPPQNAELPQFFINS